MPSAHDFIIRWRNSGAAERANYALFLSELCDLLGVERPNPATDSTETTEGRIPWPEELSAQIQAVQRIVAGMPGPVTPEQVARGFEHKKLSAQRLNTIAEVLAALEALGLVQSAANGAYSA